ncbi:MAG TPA: PilZ domain-containing protein [Arenimonas sp.]|uniref:PilZ domain-containing protein n=1 Tax=Arenimonas sp. TaxID=1872635 RepID=UPI002C406956|nr:PilZ domain-containing protein [Arenimonas sp.]HMB57979.1 PilZ domain-containing protein [Arenimonas sp.]
MNDYRRARRRKVGYNVEIVDTMTELPIGKLSNLSESGMLLILQQPLVNDALYQFRFRLPDHTGVERAIEVGAHELWADEAAAPGQAWSGFRFIDVAPTDLAYIRDWVDAPGSQYV